MLLLSSRSPRFCVTQERVAPLRVLLIPKLRSQFAEFLQRSSPKRLSLLDPPTCVGLGYGLISFAFSWKHLTANEIHLSFTIYMLRHLKDRSWIITRIPIGYSFRLGLRDRLNLFGLTSNRNPWVFGDNVLHYLSLLMSAFSLLISPALSYDRPSQTYRTFRYLEFIFKFNCRFGRFL